MKKKVVIRNMAEGGGRVVLVFSLETCVERTYPNSIGYGANHRGTRTMLHFLGVIRGVIPLSPHMVIPGYPQL